MLIEVKDLCKHFRDGTVKALDGVSLTICKGDVIVIIGPVQARTSCEPWHTTSTL